MQQRLALNVELPGEVVAAVATAPVVIPAPVPAPVEVSGVWRSPVYDVRAVPLERVQANTYNPNAVAPPEMALLETSIWEDGFTQPVVTYYDPATDMYIVVDGFHRYLTMHQSTRIRERERGLLPCVVIDKEMGLPVRLTSSGGGVARHEERLQGLVLNAPLDPVLFRQSEPLDATVTKVDYG